MRFGDLPLLVDDVCDAFRVLVLRRLRRAVRDSDFAIGIAQKRKRKLEFLGEALVRIDVVEAGAKDLDVLVLVVFVEVPEPGTFRRSAGCVGFGKEPQHDLLAAEIAQLPPFSSVICDFEIRSGIAHLQHRFASEQ